MNTLLAIYFIHRRGMAPQMVVLDTHTTDKDKAYHFACANGFNPKRKTLTLKLVKIN